MRIHLKPEGLESPQKMVLGGEGLLGKFLPLRQKSIPKQVCLLCTLFQGDQSKAFVKFSKAFIPQRW